METLLTSSLSMADVSTMVKNQAETTRTYSMPIDCTLPIDMKNIYIAGDRYKISDWAMAQLTSKMGIPYKYFKRCHDCNKDLWQSTYRLMGEKYEGEIKFKTYNGEVVGALSPRYSEVSNVQISNVLNSVGEFEDMHIRNHRISPERLHLRFTEKKPILDDLYCGVQISNSEIGKTALSFRFFIYKQICTNGMGFNKIESNIFKKKHVGITSVDVNNIQEGLACLDDFKRLASTAIEESMKERLTDKEMNHVFDTLQARHLISKNSLESMPVEYFINRYGKTKWAVANIITELSQQFTLDTRIALEEYAGNFIA